MSQFGMHICVEKGELLFVKVAGESWEFCPLVKIQLGLLVLGKVVWDWSRMPLLKYLTMVTFKRL